MTRRGTTNKNDRGSARDRRARKRYLLRAHGDGERAPCYRCGKLLTYEMLTVDRVVPGAHGGTYRRDNVRPACAGCNSSTGGAIRRLATIDPAARLRVSYGVAKFTDLHLITHATLP